MTPLDRALAAYDAAIEAQDVALQNALATVTRQFAGIIALRNQQVRDAMARERNGRILAVERAGQ